MRRRDRAAAAAVVVSLMTGVPVAAQWTSGHTTTTSDPPPALSLAADRGQPQSDEPAGRDQGMSEVSLLGPASTPPQSATAGRRPPKGTLQVRSRYIKHYRAKRATWDQVIIGGSRLPKTSARCRDAWRSSGKDRRLNWKSADYLCLNQIGGRGKYLPQGIGGSATTRRYSIGRKPAASRNLVLTSWYSRAREPRLFAPNRAGESVTRLMVMDLDKRRYNRVELVRPTGRKQFRNLNSHASGLAWAGQYLYVSSRSVLFVFNADDILKIKGRFVLPAVARWTVHGHGGLSSISIDRSASPDQLKAINYTKSGPTYIQNFNLRKDGLLASSRGRAAHDLAIRNRWGERRRVVHSVNSARIPGASYQGVGEAGRYCFATSSALATSRSKNRKVDATAVFREGKLIGRFQMPRQNIESIYIDYKRGLYTSITEGGSQFMFSLPFRRIIKAAER